MAVDDFNPADIDELVAELIAADPSREIVRSASLNPDEVNVPGVWVRLDSLDKGTLSGLRVRLTLHMIVSPAGGFARTLAQLAGMWNLLRPVVARYGGPTGPVTRVSVILAANAAPMPALAVPLDLLTEQEE